MYYKIYTTYEDDLKYLDELIKMNYIIIPILNLFILVGTNKEIHIIQEKNIGTFRDIEQYKSFFNKSIYEIFELVSLIFIEEIPDNNWIKNYSNSFSYYILSTRCAMEKRYLEC